MASRGGARGGCNITGNIYVALQRYPLWNELSSAEQARILAHLFRSRSYPGDTKHIGIGRIHLTASFLGRTMRLTQLAPDLVDAILDGRQPRCLTLGHYVTLAH